MVTDLEFLDARPWSDLTTEVEDDGPARPWSTASTTRVRSAIVSSTGGGATDGRLATRQPLPARRRSVRGNPHRRVGRKAVALLNPPGDRPASRWPGAAEGSALGSAPAATCPRARGGPARPRRTRCA